MTDLRRVTGTKTITPQGPITLAAPGDLGKIYLQSAQTVVTEDFFVGREAVVNTKLIVGQQGTTSTLVILTDQTTNVGSPGVGYIPPLWSPATPFNYDTTEHRLEAALYVPGGVGIEKDLNVGGVIYGRLANAVTSQLVNIDNTDDLRVYYPTFTDAFSTSSYLFGDSTGADGGLTYIPSSGLLTTDRIKVSSNENATDPTSGALHVVGGVGIEQDVYIGSNLTVTGDIASSNIYPNSDNYYKIGEEGGSWREAYLNKIFTNLITSTTGTVQIDPAAGLTEIVGNLRVKNGTNPIGTAPVVTNILYVTMDGDDTNDGRAMDPSRACRTIGAAINSPYYQSGTQIRVAPGHYLEDNPLQLKPYTSIMGSDLRTCSIEPINKTQDLFHMNSGCYLAFMQFLNGRSGLLEGPYDSKFNRGAYCTAFPPLTGDDRIDLYHSPYIQNCTNLSGPWLRDGTMFVPNQTVQIPLSIGTGTWNANTTSIVVSISSGTVSRGMTINAGQQNPGFFNARTLMLANKPFIQEQVVRYIDETFNSGTAFSYDPTKCSRDTSLIIDSIATDLMQDSFSESIFAGLQYWNQGSYTGEIASEITTTTSAINFVKGLAITAATSAGGATPAGVVSDRFDDILDILNAGNTNGVTDIIISNGLASTNANTVAAYNALIAAKASIASQTISYVNNTLLFTNYTTATCYRDVGYMIDSVAFDLLHGGNKQSIKSGVYYYGYNSSTAVPNEIPQVSAAYSFIKTLITHIVRADPVPVTYQLFVGQNLGAGAGATEGEVTALNERIDFITNIIRNGPSVVDAKIPINLTTTSSPSALTAYNLLMANSAFIVAEVIAYIDQTFTGSFNYAREKCFRDVGILVENIAYDASFGGNEKAVESGLAYYNGVVSYISGQEVQTTAAIDYLGQLSRQVITNTTCTDLLSGTGTSQVINWVLTGGEVASDSISNLTNIITDIINNGPSAAPVIYNSTGPDAAFISAEILMQANRKFIQEDTVNWINNTFLEFPYSEKKCRRDTKLIVDSIAFDLLYPTVGNSQSTFAGLQYWTQENYTGSIKAQLAPTISAITYLKELTAKIIKNVTPADDLIDRYYSGVYTQDVSLEPASDDEIAILNANFNIILEIVGGNYKGWTDRFISNGLPSNLASIKNALALIAANKNYMAAEIVAYVNTNNPGFPYDAGKCARDVGYMLDSVGFDMSHGGNKQSIMSGLYYYGFDGSTSIHNQTTATIAAFNYLASIAGSVVQNLPVTPYQTKYPQITTLPSATGSEYTRIVETMSTITNIINNGPTVAAAPMPISLTMTSNDNVKKAFGLLIANRNFLAEETIAFIDRTYNANSFNYNEELCYRDVGLIVDAVSQDIMLGGNYKSIEAGLAYWNKGYNHVSGQETTTTMAINHARDIALQVIANTPVTPQTGTITTQVINTFFQYGGDYMPQQSVARSFDIITKIIEQGPEYAPPKYMGGGLFALVGINGADVKIAPKVNSVSTLTTGTYLIGLSQPTIGSGTNATLYFGDTLVFPYQDKEVEALSLELTGSTSTWNQRKVDPIGGMGGSLVDGAVISDRSPIQSFVYDAFTQLTQGGHGVKITNNGYAQLVSVFTIFASVGVQVTNGGIASIVNSNANFGDVCLLAKGFGTRKFTGTVYNPLLRAFDSITGETSRTNGALGNLDQYYPNGFWPNGGKVEIFLPDLADRPHISLVMEIEPPEGHTNEQELPGFLNAAPNTALLSTGTITITDIDTDGIAIGNTLYIRDQYGLTTSTNVDLAGNWIPYVSSDTVVTDLGYRSVTLSKALTSGGGQAGNDNYFNLYFCGSAYYTVLSSTIAENPKANNINLLSAAATGGNDQIAPHIASLRHLNTITNQIISNAAVSFLQTGTVQTFNTLVTAGYDASTFINLRFQEIINIVDAADVTAAEAVIKPSLRTKTGPAVQGASAAISLLKTNIEFIADEVNAYVKQQNPTMVYNESKCQRDVKIIVQRLIYDIESGGRYNSVMTGLSYWSRYGTHHIVTLGENVRRTDLFPDGSTVNFYQRSYISASGYVFEYVGAGTNYGALPQRGISDPVQGKETVQLGSGKVFFTSTDQNGDFRIGPGLVISQATGVLSGRTFTKSLFANMTPFILAIEGGAL